jgi:hypothetical protein
MGKNKIYIAYHRQDQQEPQKFDTWEECETFYKGKLGMTCKSFSCTIAGREERDYCYEILLRHYQSNLSKKQAQAQTKAPAELTKAVYYIVAKVECSINENTVKASGKELTNTDIFAQIRASLPNAIPNTQGDPISLKFSNFSIYETLSDYQD